MDHTQTGKPALKTSTRTIESADGTLAVDVSGDGTPNIALTGSRLSA